MARADSQDLRYRMIKTAIGGLSARQAAARYGVGVSTAILWVRRARSGEVSARRQGQPKGSKLDAHATFLLERIDASAHASLHEMQTRLKERRSVSAGIGTLWRFFHRRAITVKKPRTPESATGPTSGRRGRLGLAGNFISTRNGWCSLMRPAHSPRWPADTDVARRQRLRVGIPHGHWRTTTFVTSLRLSEFSAPMVFNGPMTGPWFAAYVEPILVPTLWPGEVVILGNLPPHKSATVQARIEAAGATLMRLPPCSPDFNLIEQAFATLKALLRKAVARTKEVLWQTIGELLDEFSPEECANSFRAAGYEPE